MHKALNFSSTLVQQLLHSLHELLQLHVRQPVQVEAVGETPVRPRVFEIGRDLHPQDLDALSAERECGVLRRIKVEGVEERELQTSSLLPLGDRLPRSPVRIDRLFVEERPAVAGDEVLRVIVQLRYAHRFDRFESGVFRWEV